MFSSLYLKKLKSLLNSKARELNVQDDTDDDGLIYATAIKWELH